MSQRRSQAVRRRAAARRSLKTVAARPAGERQQLSDAPFLDEDGVDAGLGEEVGLDPPWQSADVSEKVVEALVTEEPSRREPTAVVDDEGTPGTERLILLYLQEAGTVPLLTAADEVRLAEQLQYRQSPPTGGAPGCAAGRRHSPGADARGLAGGAAAPAATLGRSPRPGASRRRGSRQWPAAGRRAPPVGHAATLAREAGGRQNCYGHRQPPPGGGNRETLSQPRPPVARSDPGGQSGADAGGGEIRPAAGLSSQHLCQLVDSPGHRPRAGRSRRVRCACRCT